MKTQKHTGLIGHLRTIIVILCVGLFAPLLVAPAAQASAPVILSGSQWFGGAGANVCSGSQGPSCDTEAAVGSPWQCVELAQRFYKKMGWYSGYFPGVHSAYQIYDVAPSMGMSRQANGRITSIVRGDMIIHASTDPVSKGDGHVAVVDSINGSTVNAVEQNASSSGRATYNLNGGTLSRGSIPIRGIVHAPGNTSSGSTPPPVSNWNGVGGASFVGKSTLYNGETLQSNQYVLSENGRYVLMMQTDGNLVAYGWGHSIWASNTSGNPGAYLGLQSDGNMVIYAADRHPVWSTGTNGVQSLVMQDDGNIVAYATNGTKQWASDTVIGGNDISYRGTDELPNGATLTAKQFIRSTDKRYFTLMQDDGNIVIYAPGYRVIWASNTSGNAGAYLGVQGDGNVVIYAPGGRAVWSTGTRNINTMVMQTDGNLVGYSVGGQAPWASNTPGRL